MARHNLARLLRPLMGAALIAGVGSCALLEPLPGPVTPAERLAAMPTRDLPLDRDVVIHWHERQVPFIVAETDADAAFALGLVHAHLRLGQMEIMRRIAYGRLSEGVGPFAIDIDRALRILGFHRAAPAIEAGLPDETRAWLQRFADGINHYQASVEELPYDARLMGVGVEPWTVQNLISVGRLAATDVNWLLWFRLWKHRDTPAWPSLWAELVRDGADSTASFADSDVGTDAGLDALTELLGGYSKSGSNSFVVSPGRSESGNALMANDPHLGFLLPNLWLLAGIQSPSYHMVGLMVPGLPFVAVGRNKDIAWGGTNMRAASSDLFDVSDLPAGDIRETVEPISVRWWFDSEVTVRETPLGPIISDAPQLAGDDDAPGPPVALRWMGHKATDEISAMLAVNRAADWPAFRQAFETFAVSAQNMLFADAQGNIGQVLATQLPARDPDLQPSLISPPGVAAAWEHILTSSELPASLNPQAGYLVSANNRPADAPVPVGWFFSPDDRIARISTLLADDGAVSMQRAGEIQRDVTQPSAKAVRDAVVAAATSIDLASSLDDDGRAALALIEAFDGTYDAALQAPVAFEAFFAAFVPEFYDGKFAADALESFVASADIGARLPGELAMAPAGRVDTALRAGVAAAVVAIAEFASWGDMHRLALGHPLRMLPVIGGRFEFVEFGVSGSRQTVMKTNASPSGEKHTARYGSQARHISDMGDIDENYFVLLGGQDGFMGSTTFVDQVDLWRAGDYIRMPLRPESVERDFTTKMVLRRASKPN